MDATIADAMLDRLLAQARCIALKGESLRPGRPPAATDTVEADTRR